MPDFASSSDQKPIYSNQLFLLIFIFLMLPPKVPNDRKNVRFRANIVVALSF